ncbi:hypothetical protein PROFUN_01924 [Planoprotostelium fungivorum]|uniref:Uncharacterized protein n=1 Tax=Planoprotostelium fungivorum TaxID=1890364 RepID=A0A2P6NZ25_9EUKA|nr:hypothetical protein PROFUN_01924 [Planoprotostelium fungivorum]
MRSSLLLLCIALFGSALALAKCAVNGVCCYCPNSSTCDQFNSNPSAGRCDDGSVCQTCPSSTTSTSSGSSNGQYASLAGTYKTSDTACSSSFWADGYSLTPSGTNSYVLTASDNNHQGGTVIQYSDSTFSIFQDGTATCSGVKTDAHKAKVACINGCSATLTGGSGMVVANIFLVVAAVSALLAL